MMVRNVEFELRYFKKMGSQICISAGRFGCAVRGQHREAALARRDRCAGGLVAAPDRAPVQALREAGADHVLHRHAAAHRSQAAVAGRDVDHGDRGRVRRPVAAAFLQVLAQLGRAHAERRVPGAPGACVVGEGGIVRVAVPARALVSRARNASRRSRILIGIRPRRSGGSRCGLDAPGLGSPFTPEICRCISPSPD